LLILYRGSLSGSRLLLPAGATVLIGLILISFNQGWWGGHSYGPRLTTDLVPWLFLGAVIALAAREKSRKEASANGSVGRIRGEGIALVLTCLWGVFVHGRGAISPSTFIWNAVPESIDKNPARVWDWRHPQFLAGLGKEDEAGSVLRRSRIGHSIELLGSIAAADTAPDVSRPRRPIRPRSE
jgi:hypothetical protein